MKLYELILDEDENADSGVFALSLVQNPAIEADWVYFSKEGKKEQIKFATVDNDKRTIVAPVLIPDMKILRIDEYSNEEYEVYFTKQTVEKLAQKYLQDGYQSKATYEHLETIDGDVTVVESWVSKSSTKDKSALYFNRAFPVGTWFVTMKVNSEELWQDYIKTGVVKAISLEGIFDHKLVKASKIESIMEKDINTLNDSEAQIVLSKIKQVLEAQPTISSTYPGQAATGSIAPATFDAIEGCPESTQDIKLNITNRQNAIDTANYGPLNPNEPNEDYWKAKADMFKGDVASAKKALCGNCVFFYKTPEILKCIADGLGSEVDPYEAIDAGEIGYCEAFDFKCAASRTCDAWVVGGPIVE
jgi:hypothetical protein